MPVVVVMQLLVQLYLASNVLLLCRHMPLCGKKRLSEESVGLCSALESFYCRCELNCPSSKHKSRPKQDIE